MTVTGNERSGAIGRAIIGHDDFERPIGSRKNAVERLADKTLGGEHRYNAANQPLRVHLSFARLPGAEHSSQRPSMVRLFTIVGLRAVAQFSAALPISAHVNNALPRRPDSIK